jgi:hypothetical protein
VALLIFGVLIAALAFLFLLPAPVASSTGERTYRVEAAERAYHREAVNVEVDGSDGPQIIINGRRVSP